MSAGSDAGLVRPGMRYGAYPQREAAAWEPLRAVADGLHALAARWSPLRTGHAAQPCAPGSAADAAEAAAALAREGFSPSALQTALSTVSAAVERSIGVRPYAVQWRAARAMLQQSLVELDTGEGKTLALLMAAGTAALARVPTHVITSNEYLAARDAALAAQALKPLGIRVAHVSREMQADERRAAYACDIVYATAAEVGFDYLRDRLLRRPVQRHGQRPSESEPPVLRGLCLALIDEADSVLLDQARTPLILADMPVDAWPKELLQATYTIGAGLAAGTDFVLDGARRGVLLAPHALERIDTLFANVPGAPEDRRQRVDLLRQALIARHALRRDVDYLVHDDRIVLIDQPTGRTLPDSLLSRGLHAMVGAKEGLTPAPSGNVAAEITLQALFRRYWQLGGVSGTLREARSELAFLYRLTVHRVEPRLPSRRLHWGTRVFANRDAQFAAVVARTAECRAAGRPVLVGTDSVAAAKALSQHLQAQAIEHDLLVAGDDEREAQVVAGAGAAGSVTLTTNMAGRGTDISVDAQVLAAGGLHVICCTRNASARVDRQLLGRAARQGAPGSGELMLCVEDAAFANYLAPAVHQFLRRASDKGGVVHDWLARAAAHWVRASAEWEERCQRWQLVRRERLARTTLGSSPEPE